MILNYQNPVSATYFADPFALRHDGWYYAYGTGFLSGAGGAESGAEGARQNADEERAFPAMRSRDLATWEPLGYALQVAPQFRGGAHWAPEVAFRDGAFWMYYSAEPLASGDGETGDEGHRLRVARATNPVGPFVDCGVDVAPGENFSIDAHPFCDPQTGEWYLFFAKDFLDERVGTALAVARLSDDMTSLASEVQTALRPSSDWQIYERDRFVYGKKWEAWHTVEGPFVLFHQGVYYCLYSGGCWHGDNYGVSYATASHPLGPWQHAPQDGPVVLRGISGQVVGPGHNSVVIGPDGQTLFCVYHAWDIAKTARRLCIDPLVWQQNKGAIAPRVLGPTYGAQSLNLPL